MLFFKSVGMRHKRLLNTEHTMRLLKWSKEHLFCLKECNRRANLKSYVKCGQSHQFWHNYILWIDRIPLIVSGVALHSNRAPNFPNVCKRVEFVYKFHFNGFVLSLVFRLVWSVSFCFECDSQQLLTLEAKTWTHLQFKMYTYLFWEEPLNIHSSALICTFRCYLILTFR